MHNQTVVTMKQISQNAAPVSLWQRLKKAYKSGGTVEFEGHSWQVTGFRLASHDRFGSGVATVKRA